MPIWRAMRINFGQKHAAKQAKRCLLAPSGAARITGMCILFTNHGNNIYIQKALTMACILCAPFGRGANVWWKCGDRRSSSTKDQPEVGTSITVSAGSPCPSHSMHTTANDDDVSGDSPLLIYMKMIRFKRLPNPPDHIGWVRFSEAISISVDWITLSSSVWQILPTRSAFRRVRLCVRVHVMFAPYRRPYDFSSKRIIPISFLPHEFDLNWGRSIMLLWWCFSINTSFPDVRGFFGTPLRGSQGCVGKFGTTL